MRKVSASEGRILLISKYKIQINFIFEPGETELNLDLFFFFLVLCSKLPQPYLISIKEQYPFSWLTGGTTCFKK